MKISLCQKRMTTTGEKIKKAILVLLTQEFLSVRDTPEKVENPE